MWYDPPTCNFGRQVVERLLNDTASLARNVKEIEEVHARKIQALQEKMKTEIEQRKKKEKWLLCLLIASWALLFAKCLA